MVRKPKSEVSVLHAEVGGAVPSRTTNLDSTICAFCGTWSNESSPDNCLNAEISVKCAWNARPTVRQRVKIEGPDGE